MGRTTGPAGPIDVHRLAGRLKPAADPIRLSMLLQLGDRERSVGALGRAISCGKTSVSHHLTRLRLAGLVACRRAGPPGVSGGGPARHAVGARPRGKACRARSGGPAGACSRFPRTASQPRQPGRRR
jgi:hypothetical protein